MGVRVWVGGCGGERGKKRKRKGKGGEKSRKTEAVVKPGPAAML